MKWLCSTCAPRPRKGLTHCPSCTGFKPVRQAVPDEVLRERHDEFWGNES